MPPKKNDDAYLWDMLDAAQNVQEFIAGKTFHHFNQDKILKSAVERQVEIIGEAARFVSSEFKQSHDNIPWKSIIGQRHVLAHEYGEIKLERLWRVVVDDIPDLIEKLLHILPSLPPEVDL